MRAVNFLQEKKLRQQGGDGGCTECSAILAQVSSRLLLPPFVFAMAVRSVWWVLAAWWWPGGGAYVIGEGTTEKGRVAGLQMVGELWNASLTSDGYHFMEKTYSWIGRSTGKEPGVSGMAGIKTEGKGLKGLGTAGGGRGAPSTAGRGTGERARKGHGETNPGATPPQERTRLDRKAVETGLASYKGMKIVRVVKVRDVMVKEEDGKYTKEEVEGNRANYAHERNRKGWRTGKGRKWRGWIRNRRRRVPKVGNWLTIVGVQVGGLALIVVWTHTYKAGQKGPQREWQEVLELIWGSGTYKAKRCGGQEETGRGNPACGEG